MDARILQRAAEDFAVAASRVDPGNAEEMVATMATLGPILDAVGRGIDTVHATAVNQLPLHPAVADAIGQIGQNQRAASSLAGEAHSLFRRIHERDIARVEAPRVGEDRWNVAGQQQ